MCQELNHPSRHVSSTKVLAYKSSGVQKSWYLPLTTRARVDRGLVLECGHESSDGNAFGAGGNRGPCFGCSLARAADSDGDVPTHDEVPTHSISAREQRKLDPTEQRSGAGELNSLERVLDLERGITRDPRVSVGIQEPRACAAQLTLIDGCAAGAKIRIQWSKKDIHHPMS